MLTNDLDRIRIEVEAKQRLLAQKRKELSRIVAQLGARQQQGDTTSLEKTRQRLLQEISLLGEAIRSAAEDYEKSRHRLERVIAIKGCGSLPPLLKLDHAFTLSSIQLLTEPAPASAFPSPSVLPPSTKRVVNKPTIPLDQAADEKRRSTITRMVENPDIYPTVSIAQAAEHFQVAPREIHRWIKDGKLKRGARRGAVTTESMQGWKEKRARRRRS
jgi:hypothetical protein